VAEPQPGDCVGDDHAPNQYTLARHVKSGGEGDVWQATTTRQDGLTTQSWAIKIVDPHRLLTRLDETPGAALEDYHRRAARALQETAQLSLAVPGIVGPAAVFIGAAPHQLTDQPSGRSVYVVSPWVDGADLAAWGGRAPRTFEETCALLAELAAILDGMARRAAVHRDVSPGNVMVDAGGRVRLIDLTYVRPPDSAAGTVRVFTHGYTAPEAGRGDFGTAADRYSFGAVAHFLLTHREPARTGAAADSRLWLVRAGYRPAVADHVAALLAPEPDARPKSLTEWTAGLRALGHEEATAERYLAFAMAIDGTATPLVSAATPAGVFAARLGAGLAWQLTRDPAGPRGVTDIAMVTDGAGEPVTFAATGGGRIWAGRCGTWTDHGPAVAGTGLAAIRDPYGVATGYAIAHDDHELIIVTVGPDGQARRAETSRPAQRVLAAAAGAGGAPMALVVSPAGELLCVDATGATRIARDGASSAAACTDRRGELRCYRITAGQDTIEWYERAGDCWDLVDTEDMPGPATAIACAGHREGVGVAVAGPGGIYAAIHGDADFSAWRQVTAKPASHLALAIGARWRLELAALVDGQVALAEEDFVGQWQRRTRF
jgi:hypothetical protein